MKKGDEVGDILCYQGKRKLFLKIRDSFLPDIDQETIFSKKNQESSYKNQKKPGGRDPWFLNDNWQFDDHTLNRLEYLIDDYVPQEVLIPILINHSEIPQLSWGHAKYAHFVNQKGFNFIEFKHAEHLPVSKKESLPNPSP